MMPFQRSAADSRSYNRKSLTADTFQSLPKFGKKQDSSPTNIFKNKLVKNLSLGLIFSGLFLPTKPLKPPTAMAGSALSNETAPLKPLSPEHEEVLSLLQTTWQTLNTEGFKASDPGWSLLRPNFYTTAHLKDPSLDNIRKQLLTAGDTDTGIPPCVLQDNIAALRVLGRENPAMDDNARNQWTEALKKYQHQMLVEYDEAPENPGTPKIRHRALVDEAVLTDASWLQTHANVTTYPEIRQAARHAAGTLASTQTQNALMEEYMSLKEGEQKQGRLESITAFPDNTPISDLFREHLGDEIDLQLNQYPEAALPQDVQVNLARKMDFLASRPQTPEALERLERALKMYFQHSSYPTVYGAKPRIQDLTAMKALAKLALTHDSAYELLFDIIGQHPEIFIVSAQHYFTGKYTDAYETGNLLNRVLSNRAAETRKRLIQWATRPVDSKSVSERQKSVALSIMASRPIPEYLPVFQGILFQSMEKDPETPNLRYAIAGIAALRHEAALKPLLDVMRNPKIPQAMRVMAGEGILKLMSNPEYPEALSRKIQQDFPIFGDLESFWMDLDGAISPNTQGSPFQAWMKEWTEKEQISDLPKLARIGQQKSFRDQQLKPLLAQIERKNESPEWVSVAIQILGACRYQPSEFVLKKVAETPRQFYPETGLPPQQISETAAKVRVTALRSLGSVASGNHPESVELFYKTLSSSIFEQYRLAAIYGLSAMGVQTGEELSKIQDKRNKNPHDQALTARRDHLTSFRKSQVQRLMKAMVKIENSPFRDEQDRYGKNEARYRYALAIGAFGGEDVLLERMHQTFNKAESLKAEVKQLREKGDEEHAVAREIEVVRNTDIARDIANAFISTGKALKDPGVKYFLERHYWNVDKLHAMGATGKGAKVMIFDGCFAYPLIAPPGLKSQVPKLEGKIVYPDGFIFRPEYFDGSHWLIVMDEALQVAPDISKISTRSYLYSQKPDPDMTLAMTDPYVISQINALTNLMRAPEDPKKEEADVAMNSWGVNTSKIHDPEYRETLNLISGGDRSLRAAGVTVTMSAGNGGYNRPVKDFSDERGVSPIGDSYDEKGQYTPTPGIFFFAPTDGAVAELSLAASVPNQLNPNDSRPVYGAPGDLETTLRIDDYTRLPVKKGRRGSSIAQPAGAAAIAISKQIRKDLGYPPWTIEEEAKAMMMASSPPSDLGVRMLDPLKLAELAMKEKLEAPSKVLKPAD